MLFNNIKNMKNEDILICITNHNNNDNALTLKNNFSKYFDTIIIDSKSDIILDEFDIKLSNVYYTGLFNESYNQTKERNKKYCFFIASDVYVENIDSILDCISSLDDDIYIWVPSSKGQSHLHCKNFNSNGLREVPYVEGFCFLSHIDVLSKMTPVSTSNNKYGYGIDLLMGFICIKNLRKKCVVDDRVEIYHREGTGYDQSKALQDMYNWMLSNPDNQVKEYTILYSKSPGHNTLLQYLKF